VGGPGPLNIELAPWEKQVRNTRGPPSESASHAATSGGCALAVPRRKLNEHLVPGWAIAWTGAGESYSLRGTYARGLSPQRGPDMALI
jgi:hypothetical protein